MSGIDKNGFVAYCKLVAIEPSPELIKLQSEMSKGDFKSFSDFFFSTYEKTTDGTKLLLQLQEIHRTILYSQSMAFMAENFNEDLSLKMDETDEEYLENKTTLQKIRNEVNSIGYLLLNMNILYAEYLEGRTAIKTPLSNPQYAIFFKILFDKGFFPEIESDTELSVTTAAMTGKSYKQLRKTFSRNSKDWKKENIEKVKNLIVEILDDEIENLPKSKQ